MTPSSQLLQSFDVPGPRYTSYPTADRFVEAFAEREFLQALQLRRHSARSHAFPLSVYVHIPFCESLCYYCACNKIITGKYERAEQYLKSLQTEVELLLPHLGTGNVVSQLHLGGGTPTFLLDPRTVDAQRLKTLRELGFNRLSLGVQDFDKQVQIAVHREQTVQQVQDLMLAARGMGFKSVNLDLIYGLPKQTTQSWTQTLHSVAQLRPERIALYAYAHLPARFKPQRHINASELPMAEAKTAMLSQAIDVLQSEGYVYIGMDHFALPEDALAIAKRQGRLHRNFQGYTTQPDCDLIGLGVSSIGNIGATYQQNTKSLDEYQDMLEQGRLPVVRGVALSKDDLLRRSVIMALMCQGTVEFDIINSTHLIDFKHYFQNELLQLTHMQAQGIVHLDDKGIEVTDIGWFVIRAIAMVFDRYLQGDQQRMRFSKIL